MTDHRENGYRLPLKLGTLTRERERERERERGRRGGGIPRPFDRMGAMEAEEVQSPNGIRRLQNVRSRTPHEMSLLQP
jgi:hypothetical protein